MAAQLEILIRAVDQASAVIKNIGDSSAASMANLQKAATAVGVSMAAAGAGLEAFARMQRESNLQCEKLATGLGMTDKAFRELAISARDAAGQPMKEVLDLMTLARKEGVDSAEGVKKFAQAWDEVADATGGNAVELAQAGVALRAVGIDADNVGDAYSAFGLIQSKTTLGVQTFIDAVGKAAPEMNRCGVSVDEAAIAFAFLESKGITGRKAIAELNEAMKNSDGTMQGVYQQLGMNSQVQGEYNQKLAESGGVIQKNAALYEESFTPMQKIQTTIENIVFANGEWISKLADLSPILVGVGGGLTALGQSGILTGTGLAATASGAIAAAGGIAGIGATIMIAIPYVAALAAAALILYTAWTQNWGGIQEKTGAAVDYIEKRTNAAKGVLEQFGTSAKGVWQSFSDGVASLTQTGVAADQSAKKIDALGLTFKTTGAQFDLLMALCRTLVVELGNIATAGITKMFEELGRVVNDQVKGFEKFVGAFGALKPVLEALKPAIDAVSDTFKVSNEVIKMAFSPDKLDLVTKFMNTFSDNGGKLKTSQQEVAGAIDTTNKKVKTQEEVVAENNAILEEAKSVVDKLSGAYDSLVGSIDEFTGKQLNAANAQDEVTIAAEKVVTAQKNLNTLQKSGKATAAELAEANITLRNATADYDEKVRHLTETQNDLALATKDLQDIAKQYGIDATLSSEEIIAALEKQGVKIAKSVVDGKERVTVLTKGEQDLATAFTDGSEKSGKAMTTLEGTVASTSGNIRTDLEKNAQTAKNSPIIQTYQIVQSGMTPDQARNALETALKAGTAVLDDAQLGDGAGTGTGTNSQLKLDPVTGQPLYEAPPNNPKPLTTAQKKEAAVIGTKNGKNIVMQDGIEVFQDGSGPVPGQTITPSTPGEPVGPATGGIGYSAPASNLPNGWLNAGFNSADWSPGLDAVWNEVTKTYDVVNTEVKKSGDAVKTAVLKTTDVIKDNTKATKENADVQQVSTAKAVRAVAGAATAQVAAATASERAVTNSNTGIVASHKTASQLAQDYITGANQLIAGSHAATTQQGVVSATGLQTGTTGAFSGMATEGVSIMQMFKDGVLGSLAQLRAAAASGGSGGGSGGGGSPFSSGGVGYSNPVTNFQPVLGGPYAGLSLSDPAVAKYLGGSSLARSPSDFPGADAMWALGTCGSSTFAEGGTVGTGGVVVVGEKGPELLNLPGGSKVTPLSGKADVIDYGRMTDAFTIALSRTKGRQGETHIHVSGIWDKSTLKTLARMLKQVDITENLRTGRSTA